MSSSGITATNSGPLIIRTVLDQSADNTYVLGQYDFPVSSNRVLTTSTNGLLVPTDNLIISSIKVSSIQLSTLFDRDGITGTAGEVLHTDGTTAYWGPSGAGTGYWTEFNSNQDIFNNNPRNVYVNSTLFASTISTNYITMTNGQIIGPSFISSNTLSVNASSIYYTANDPTYIDTFKIELSGSNFLVYKSTIGSKANTYIQNDGGDQIMMGTSIPVLYINGANQTNTNVGIGTSTPQSALDVAGTVQASAGFLTQNTYYSAGPTIFTSGYNYNSTVLIYAYDVTNGDMIQLAPPGNSLSQLTFKTATSNGTVANEKMRLTNNGYLGLNTSTPIAVLDVAGTANIASTLSVSTISSTQVIQNLSIRAGIDDYTNKSEFARIASTGVGINKIAAIDYIVTSDGTGFGGTVGTWQDARYVYNPADSSATIAQAWGILLSTNANPSIGINIGDVRFYHSVNVTGNLNVSGTAVSRVACSTITTDPGNTVATWLNYFGKYLFINGDQYSTFTLPYTSPPADGTLVVTRNIGAITSLTVSTTAIDTTIVLAGKTTTFIYTAVATPGWYSL